MSILTKKFIESVSLSHNSWNCLVILMKVWVSIRFQSATYLLRITYPEFVFKEFFFEADWVTYLLNEFIDIPIPRSRCSIGEITTHCYQYVLCFVSLFITINMVFKFLNLKYQISELIKIGSFCLLCCIMNLLIIITFSSTLYPWSLLLSIMGSSEQYVSKQNPAGAVYKSNKTDVNRSPASPVNEILKEVHQFLLSISYLRF